jgi:hypothetical protein
MALRLDIIPEGNVQEQLSSKIRHILEDCYERLGTPISQKVQLCLFDSGERMQRFFEQQKSELGISTVGDEEFILSHDAWQGFPRLVICVERLTKLSRLAALGAIRHEVAHTILHGSIEYYILRIDSDTLALAKSRGISSDVLRQIAYLVSIAVKDFEATRLLVNHDYIQCQIAFALEQLTATEEDRLTWLLARSNEQAKILCLTAFLKPLLFIQPLWRDLENQGLLQPLVTSFLQCTGEEGEGLQQMVELIASKLGNNTQENVHLALAEVLKHF